MAKESSPGGGFARQLRGKKIVRAGKRDWQRDDKINTLIQLHGGSVLEELSPDVHFLLLPELTQGIGMQKKANALNQNGASILVMSFDDFLQKYSPTDEQVILGIRHSATVKLMLEWLSAGRLFTGNYRHVFRGDDLRNLTVSDAQMHGVAFDRCDLSGAHLTDCTLDSIEGCKFAAAALQRCRLDGNKDGVDFGLASLNECSLHFYSHAKKPAPPIFKKARLIRCNSTGVCRSADFSAADLSDSGFATADLSGCNFTDAILKNVNLAGADLRKCDFTNADLSGANLAGAKMDGAILSNANLHGTILLSTGISDKQLATARHADKVVRPCNDASASIKELDRVATGSVRLTVCFEVTKPDGKPIDVRLQATPNWLWGNMGEESLQLPNAKLSDAFPIIAAQLAQNTVRFETVTVSGNKSVHPTREICSAVVKVLSDTFSQAIPEESILKKLTKDWRDQQKKQREAQKAKTEKTRQKEIQKKLAALPKPDKPVTDLPSFLTAIAIRSDEGKVDKARRMLKADKFKLFADVTDTHMSGVVKSQSDPDLIYACRVDHEGNYACCTQNMNICGGLRGSVCKHLLVLIIGLVQAGELDPATIDGWVAKTQAKKAELNKDVMGEIFLKYKGAEAGEIDWRPTETLPEDFYAV